MTVRREDHFAPHDLYLGIDVGKSFHWAMGLEPSGKIAAGRRVENRVSDVDAPLEGAEGGALVVVDQKSNIGSLVVRRCRARGVDVGHVPGRATGQARDMFPGTAKTDRTGAGAVARTALGMRRVVLPIAESDDPGASVSLPSPRLACATRRATMARNRLRAVLLECDPAFEAAADPSSAWQPAAGRRRHGSICGRRGARAAARDGPWGAAVAPAGEGWHPDAEDVPVRSLAAEVLAADSERPSIERDLAGRLSGDETHRCLPAVPGIGPKTATALVPVAGVSLFDGDDRLASFCGLAPSDSRSGTSIGSSRSSRAGNRQLKSLLMFSCNSLAGTRSRFGRYYDECVSRGMRHNRAPEAVARKRLGAIYAIMRDRVPYEEPPPDTNVENSRRQDPKKSV